MAERTGFAASSQFVLDLQLHAVLVHAYPAWELESSGAAAKFLDFSIDYSSWCALVWRCLQNGHNGQRLPASFGCGDGEWHQAMWTIRWVHCFQKQSLDLFLDGSGQTHAFWIRVFKSFLKVASLDSLQVFMDTGRLWKYGWHWRTVHGKSWKILSGTVLVSTLRGDFACHHLLVCNAEEDSNHVRLLSALDIARGLLARSSEESWKEAAIIIFSFVPPS